MKSQKTILDKHQTQSNRQTILIRATFLAIVLLALSAFAFVGWRVTHGDSRLAAGVTIESIRAIENGMTEAEVLVILGDPMARTMSLNEPDVVTLTYSEPVYFAKWYPMLWIHLRDGQVFDVYGKRYIEWGLDDVGVYGTGNGQWETELFEQTFPLETGG